MFDGKAFGEEMVGIVKGFVDRATAPLLQRIAALEAREPERGEKGEAGLPGADGAPGANGRDGVDGQPGSDGKNGVDGVDGQPGRDGDRGADGRDGSDGEHGGAGKDGVGLAGALIDRGGALVVTLTDGSTRELGPVVGKDGIAGRDGADGNVGADGSNGREGRDGTDGRDGVDGFGFDDLTFEHDGERGFVLRFVRGERTKEFSFAVPVVLDRGVYKAEAEYQQGDAATFGGSLWIAQRATSAKPDGADTGWRLAVKKGRDGKDAVKA